MKERFCYEYPRPAVTTDCVMFCFHESELKVLLIERASDPFRTKWAFPGGFIEMEETAENCALRELEEETGIRNVVVEQFRTFSKVDRDPRGRTISIAFYGLVRVQDINTKAGDDAAGTAWFPVSAMPPLAFDHDEVFKLALRTLHHKIRSFPVVFELLDEKFSLPQIQKIYESVLDIRLDRRNFRKKILRTGLLIDLNESASGEGHKGAKLYRLDGNKYRHYMENEGSFQVV